MIPSKLTLNKEMQLAIERPGITKEHKRELRMNAIKDYIHSKPNGTPIRVSELIRAAGYDPTPGTKSYAAGFSFLKYQVQRGVLIKEEVPMSASHIYYIPEDAKQIKPPAQSASTPAELPALPNFQKDMQELHQLIDAIPQDIESHIDHEAVVEPSSPPSVPTSATPFEVEQIISAAKDFFWETQSDSLREFVKYLSNKETK